KKINWKGYIEMDKIGLKGKTLVESYKALEGQKVGHLTLEEYVGVKHFKNTPLPSFRCSCDCGNEKIVPYQYIKQGYAKSCGKCRQESRWLGKKIGKLTVIGIEKGYKDENGKQHPMKLRCKCDCGKITTVNASAISSGRTVSCGCAKLNGERIVETFNDDERKFISYVQSSPQLFSDKIRVNQMIRYALKKIV
ncbi:hypothetical protein IJ556_01910, partial [bacterium]|nr:hypothetical protein [bacterium]